MKRGKGGKILMENVIFIILNVLFLMILILFLARQGQGAHLLEQSYAKQIALLIDSAEPQPSEVIKLNFDKGFEIIEEDNLNINETIVIDKEKNMIIVSLGKGSGTGVRFFSDYEINHFPDKATKKWIITINKNKEIKDEIEE